MRALATVRALFGDNQHPDPEMEAGTDGAVGGDDDSEEELTAVPADEAISDADFYRDAFDTIW